MPKAACWTSTLLLTAVLGMPEGRAEDRGGVGASIGRPLDGATFSLRLMLGVGDLEPQVWDGAVTLDRGEVVNIEGWRFREGDQVESLRGWKGRTRRVRHKPAAAENDEAGRLRPDRYGPSVVPTGVVITIAAPPDATLTVRTERGTFAVALTEFSPGAARSYLNGAVEARRVPAAIPLRDGPGEQDFPAAAADIRGDVWVAYVEHTARGPEVLEALTQRPHDFSAYIPTGGGDQVRLIRFAGGKPSPPIDVTEPGHDVWRPAAAIDADGRVVVAWSENRDGNWDLFSRWYDPVTQSWSAPRRLTDAPGTDASVVLAASPGGPVWMAWQRWIDGQADILAAPLDATARAVNLGIPAANDWAPAIAVDASGKVHVAFDTYAAGSYDVLLRSLTADGSPGPVVSVAASDRFEARPSLAADPRGRIWVAYEERTENWGKDANDLVNGRGSTLYRASSVRVRCLDGDRLLDAPDPVAVAPESLRALNSFPRLAADRSGRIWLAFRHREEYVWGDNVVLVPGGVWLEYATSLGGRAWDPPQVLPRSDGLLDSRPSLAVPADGPVLIVYGGDGRLRREVESTPDLARRYWTHSGTPTGISNHDLQVATLLPAGSLAAVVDPVADRPVNPGPAKVRPAPVHVSEPADIARMRTHRIRAGGKTYRPLRGEFHRHTEISQDGGHDGALEDMWRYAIDAAGLDWIGNGDHDNGGSKEYTWWLVQKTTDLYQVPAAFTPLFTYERSVAYPGGHRNVMFPYRGVRTLPRLIDGRGVRTDVGGNDEDAAMLYDYLHALGGICAAHTTGTGGGTDWRANDPAVEPLVEIYQGFRNSYEHPGAPRTASGAAMKPKGMIWSALALRYRLGFEASSDHVSTHTSFAVALAEDHSRQAIFEAFKKRHCYAATDNILLEVRSGEHLMGDEFVADAPVKLQVAVHGTAPIKRIDIIKDAVYAYSAEPRAVAATFSWTDESEPKAGVSWYYVRVIQEDGELAWGSPLWITRRGAGDR